MCNAFSISWTPCHNTPYAILTRADQQEGFKVAGFLSVDFIMKLIFYLTCFSLQDLKRYLYKQLQRCV